VQREFREIKGTTVIIYDQTCATEKRRRRKRGTLVDPAKRVVINELVCEGCGDCGVQSNCLSVEPLETEFGRKRQHQPEHLQQGLFLRQGLLPELRHRRRRPAQEEGKRQGRSPFELGALPEPVLPVLTQAWGIVVAGVGGTGVITIGQLLGVAAHLEGKGIVTQDAGRPGAKGRRDLEPCADRPTQDDIRTTKVSMAAADLVIGCDPIVTAARPPCCACARAAPMWRSTPRARPPPRS
jgi:indolepyruvate ferredoxin oxidoreductase